MAKKLLLHFVLCCIIVFLITSCNKDKLEAPLATYLSIPGIGLSTDSVSEGSNHHKINTVWIVINNKEMGTYDLPCTIPVQLDEGDNDVVIFPGIYLNGNSSQRAIYDPYNILSFTLSDTLINKPLDTIVVADTSLITTYKSFKSIEILESFDESGINLEATAKSDTSILKTNDPSKIFVNPQTGLNDGNVGEIILSGNQNLAEFATVESYQIPIDRANAYVEVSYRSNVPITVGVIADVRSQIIQAPTVVILPKNEWNKIYINLISEITAYNASNYKIFFGVTKPSNIDTAKVYLDNLKLVY